MTHTTALTPIRYCIQCTDKISGKIGTFGFDPARTDSFYAITPVCTDLVALIAWCLANGITRYGQNSLGEKAILANIVFGRE